MHLQHQRRASRKHERGEGVGRPRIRLATTASAQAGASPAVLTPAAPPAGSSSKHCCSARTTYTCPVMLAASGHPVRSVPHLRQSPCETVAAYQTCCLCIHIRRDRCHPPNGEPGVRYHPKPNKQPRLRTSAPAALPAVRAHPGQTPPAWWAGTQLGWHQGACARGSGSRHGCELQPDDDGHGLGQINDAWNGNLGHIGCMQAHASSRESATHQPAHM